MFRLVLILVDINSLQRLQRSNEKYKDYFYIKVKFSKAKNVSASEKFTKKPEFIGHFF